MPAMIPRWAYAALLGGLWLAWLIYWMVRARGVKAVQRRESIASRFAYIIPTFVGAWLLWRTRPTGFLADFYIPPEGRLAAYWGGVILIALGLGFSVWAREYLGGNWSGTVTLKQDHELIRSGPYRWVRHPIYTGIITALLGTAIAQGQWRGLLGFALIAGSLVYKLRIEERFLTELFGDQYRQYRREVAALLPGVF